MRNNSQAPPGRVSWLINFVDNSSSGGISLSPHTSPIAVADVRDSLIDEREAFTNSQQKINGFKAGHYDGHSKLSDEEFIRLKTGHRADVASGQEAVYPAFRRPREQFHCWLHSDVGCQETEVLESRCRRLQHSERRRWRGGFKSDGKENDLTIGTALSELNGIRRRINNLNLLSQFLTLATDLHEADFASGNSQHVAKRSQNHSWFLDQPLGEVNRFGRRDTNGTAGPMDQFNNSIQRFVQSMPQEAMSLPPANLHDDRWHRPAKLVQLFQQAPRELWIAILIKMLHQYYPRDRKVLRAPAVPEECVPLRLRPLGQWRFPHAR